MVKPKKFLGQHFLRDKNIAEKIVASFQPESEAVVEVGPGTGALTGLLVERELRPILMEIDHESVEWLRERYTKDQADIRLVDFLSSGFEGVAGDRIAVIGNFPYNISSQIFFKILDNRDRVSLVVGMIQKEVAQRIAAPPGGKICGLLSVLVQAFYEVELLFHVPPGVFNPPPKVMSTVVRLKRNATKNLPCSEDMFFRLVKRSFQNRRKTLRNALKDLNLPASFYLHPLMEKRAEQLSVSDFVELTQNADKP